MAEPTADEQLATIERLLDEGLGDQGDDGLSVVERVKDLIDGLNGWVDLGITRLHRIHRLTGEECQFCVQYLDGRA